MYKPNVYRQWQFRRPRQLRRHGPSGGLIILACLGWTIFVPFPGPFDDIVVWAIGAWIAMKGKRPQPLVRGLKSKEKQNKSRKEHQYEYKRKWSVFGRRADPSQGEGR